MVVYYIRNIKKEGPVNLLLEIVKNGARHDDNFVLIVSSIDDQNYYKLFLSHGIKILQINRFRIDLIYKIIREYKKTHRISFHSLCTTGLLLSSILPINMQRIHSCLIEIGKQGIAMNGRFKGSIINSINNLGFYRMDILVAGSTGVANSINTMNASKVRLIYNSISPSIPRQVEGISKEPFVVSASRLSPEKNVIGLVNSFKRLNLDALRLVVLGDGVDMDELMKLKALDERIDVMGFKDDYENYLRNADLFISFSQTEGLPLTVLTAMSLGIPLLLSNIDGHKDLIKDNGLLFDPRDYEDFKTSFFKVYNNRIKMGERSMSLFYERFNSEKMYVKLRQMYE